MSFVTYVHECGVVVANSNERQTLVSIIYTCLAMTSVCSQPPDRRQGVVPKKDSRCDGVSESVASLRRYVFAGVSVVACLTKCVCGSSHARGTQKSRQHSDFPGGHPPEYYPSLRLLNFAN